MTVASPAPPGRLSWSLAALIALALLSGAALALQVVLLRLFSLQQFHHFAFMVISLALLGYGAAGTVLALVGRRLVPWAVALAFALATALGWLVLNRIPFDSYALVWDPRQIAWLALYFTVAALPFFAAGLLTGQMLAETPHGAQGVYAANLLGSAAGALGVLPLLRGVSLEAVLLVIVSCGLISSALLSSPRWRVVAWLACLGAGGFLALAWRGAPAFSVRLSPYKPLSVALLAPDVRIGYSREDASARVQVVESSAFHQWPGLALAARASLPEQAALFVDGDQPAAITRLDPESPSAHDLAAHLPLGLVLELRTQAHALVLGGGGGMDAVMTLAGGAREVEVVEENGLALDALEGPYLDFSYGLYARPEVHPIRSSIRNFVRRDGGQYDLVVLALTDAYRPTTAGAMALGETYGLTVEAMSDDLARLAPRGILFMTRWAQNPPSEEARAFATLLAAMERLGWDDPAGRLFAFRTMRTVSIGVSRSPLTSGESEKIRAFLASRGFDAILYPGMTEAEVNRFFRQPEPLHASLFARLLEHGWRACADYEFDICPTRDERPFFFNFFRWGQTREVLAMVGKVWAPFGGTGYFLLLLLLAFAVAAASVLMSLPLVLGKARARETRLPAPARQARMPLMAYFGALGLGYIFLEVPLAQRATLLLERTSVAYAWVIGSLLLASGIGSLLAHRAPLRATLVALLSMSLVFAAAPVLWAGALGQSFALRALAVLAATLPLGVLMGVPFVRGLRLAEQTSPGITPWVWAVNGSFSVVAGVLAALFALEAGFGAVLTVGGLCYGAALMALVRWEHLTARCA
ncbi:MAG: hypothetical protein NTY23_09290 [Chloroflexi bacterium]|nr:hypothetical protein [Chloroflexota bacterium]